jgi:chemotaxis protein MotB
MDPEKKQFALIVGGVTAALLLAVLAFSAFNNGRALDQLKSDLEQAQSDLEQARSSLASRDTELGDLKGRLAESETRVVKLEKDKDAATQSRQSLESEMRAALESKDVTISRLQGKLTVNILDRVLFDSGEAELKPDGQEVLRKVAAVLAQHPTLKIHVIGHTDNVPIRPTNKRFASNWELSAGRATSAVRFLVETAGVDPRRVGAVAYGEFRPVADNSTPEGRARNRRIAITVLSDEAAGLDTPSHAEAGVHSGIQQTNAAPSVTNTSEGTVSSPADTNVPAIPPQ